MDLELSKIEEAVVKQLGISNFSAKIAVGKINTEKIKFKFHIQLRIF